MGFPPNIWILIWIWWLLETILFKLKVLYYLKIVTGPPKFKLKIQTLGGKPIIVAIFLKVRTHMHNKIFEFFG